MTVDKLPQPVKSVDTVIRITNAICSSLPGLATLKEFMQAMQERKIEHYQKILVDLVHECGISVLSEEQAQFYLPSAYRFFEQVRIGEYDHNLRTLGRLIAGELAAEPCGDVGKIGRAARKLEMLTFEQLNFLAMCKRGFELTHTSKRESTTPGCLDPVHMIDVFGELGISINFSQATEKLHELSVRGLLTVSGNPKTIGGHYYYVNAAFLEIIQAAEVSVSKPS